MKIFEYPPPPKETKQNKTPTKIKTTTINKPNKNPKTSRMRQNDSYYNE